MSKNVIHALLLPVAGNNVRKFCDLVENQVYKRNELIQKIKDDAGLDETEISLIEMTDFMDAVNDDKIDFKTLFMSYILIEK